MITEQNIHVKATFKTLYFHEKYSFMQCVDDVIWSKINIHSRFISWLTANTSSVPPEYFHI